MIAEARSLVGEVKPQYSLSPEEIKWRSRRFVMENATPEQLALPFSCYMLDGDDPDADLARHVELDVFFGRFKNTEDQMVHEYGPYENASKFFMVMSHNLNELGGATDFEPIGTKRIIEPSANGLKALQDLPSSAARTSQGNVITPELVYESYGIDPAKCIEIATLAVKEEWRGDKFGHIPSLLLFRAFYLQYLKLSQNFTHVVAIMDLEAKRGVDALHMPFQPILGAQPFAYLDNNPNGPQTMSQPIVAESREFYPEVTGWAQKYSNEAEQLDQLVSSIHDTPEKFAGLDFDAAEAAQRESHKKKILSLGMKLMELGKVGEGEVAIDIDLMLAPKVTLKH